MHTTGGHRFTTLGGRPLQRTVLIALVTAFIGLSLAVPAYLAPQLAEAERVHLNLGEGLRRLAGMRGAALEIRSAASLARYPNEPDPRAAIRARASELSDLADELQAADPSVRDSATWRRLRDQDIPDLVALASRAAAAAERGERRSDDFRELVAASSGLDEELGHLSEADAAAVAQIGSRMHRSLLALVWACLAIALLGGTSAVVFVRRDLLMVRAYAREAERRIADLDAFAGRVAHDLRTPLQTIMLAFSALRRASPLGDSDAAVLGRAERAARRLARMVQDLLEFSRSERATAASADLAEVARAVHDEVADRAARAKVSLRFELSPGISVKMADGTLHSLIANLVENAIKYSSDRAERYVQLGAVAGEDSVQIQVSDNGIGIAKEHVPLVFEPFFRGGERPDSYGLGLATVKRLVDAHGGEIRLDSTPGVGTTFTVTLPGHRSAASGAGEPRLATGRG